MVATTYAARGVIDVEHFMTYNSLDDIKHDIKNYKKVRQSLQWLKEKSKAEYFYALKKIGDKYVFIFNTDSNEDMRMKEYVLSPVHEQAFLGDESAGIKNVRDSWGHFNAAAIPIWHQGSIVGIVAVDYKDDNITRSHHITRINSIILVCTLCATMALMIIALTHLLRKDNEAQDQLYRIANYDAIADLPNRRYLMRELERLTAMASGALRPFTLLFIDLDNFKRVNDGAGHDAGDALLCEIAACMHDAHENPAPRVPSRHRRWDGTSPLSARVGGDEFVQVLPGIGKAQDAEAAARRLLAAFRGCRRFDALVEAHQVGLSIGVAIFPTHATDADALVRCADIAMYHAKGGGKNSCCLYAAEMGTSADAAERHFRHEGPYPTQCTVTGT
jgi:diguanylate cyclase (GGDEF)-like protein